MKKIKLTKGYYTMVDDGDYDVLSKHKWSYHSDGYAHGRININGSDRMILMHRFILDIVDSPEIFVDHKDMNGLNNQRSNLRKCTRSQNFANQKSYKGSASRFKGVTVRKNGKFRARIRKDRKLINIGTFDSETDAAKAYNDYAIDLFGDFARLNTINP